MRLLLDAVLYVLRTGCAWRHLPRDFPPWQTTLRWFLRLARSGVFERVAHALVVADRARTGRGARPTAAVVDAQAARSGGVGVAGRRGFDAARRVVGRKRHALVDTDGRLLLAAVSPADLHDSHGGAALLRTSRRPRPFLALCYADRAYAGPRVAGATPIAVELVGPKPGQRGFAVQPRRWVIERTYAWTGRCRVGAVRRPPVTTRPRPVPPSPSSSWQPPPSSSGGLQGRYEAGSNRTQPSASTEEISSKTCSIRRKVPGGHVRSGVGPYRVSAARQTQSRGPPPRARADGMSLIRDRKGKGNRERTLSRPQEDDCLKLTRVWALRPPQ